MTEVTTNLNAYSTTLSNVINTSEGAVDTMHAINTVLLTGEGIDQIIESIADESPELAQKLREDDKKSLKKPDVEFSELMGQKLQLDPEVAKKLGLKEDATIGEFMQAALNKTLKENMNSLGIKSENSETIDLLCMLLCQEGKSQIIDTLKQVLDSKVAERQNLRAQNLEKTNQMIADHVEVQEKLEAAKKTSIIAAIIGAIAAVAVAIVSIAITILTGGTGTAACVAIGLTVVATVAAVASSGCTVGSVYTNDPEKQEQLNQAALGLGICSAIIGLVGGGVEVGGAIAGAVTAAGITATVTAARTAALESAKAAAKEAVEAAIQEGIEAAAKEAAEAAAKEAAKTVMKEATEEGIETATKESIESAAKEAAEAAAKDIAKTISKETGETISEESIETIAEEAAEAATKKAFGKSAEKIIEDNTKNMDKLNTVVTIGSSLTQATTQIASGVVNLELANEKKDLANINIEIEKINQAIETLQEIINTLMQDIQKFIDDLLKCEQNAAETLHSINDVLLNIAQKPA